LIIFWLPSLFHGGRYREKLEKLIMSSIPMEYYLILSAFMFSVGVTGVLIRRNAIVVFMCIELMLNSANLTLVTFSSYLGNPIGQIFVFFVMTVAAAEAAVGLAIIIAVFRNKLSVNIDEINIFKW
jgi:NADH-quinone oxidoreductase subunit K